MKILAGLTVTALLATTAFANAQTLEPFRYGTVATKGDAGLVAVELNVRFVRPALVESELSAVVTDSRVDGRRVHVTIEVSTAGERACVVDSTFLLISEDRLRSIAGIDLADAPACLVAGRGELPRLPE